jgi:hypothetical protein
MKLTGTTRLGREDKVTTLRFQTQLGNVTPQSQPGNNKNTSFLADREQRANLSNLQYEQE